jgi:phosphoribosylanthranilate isomerase
MTDRTRIKICGLREPAHARLAADAGADAIGMVFYPPSPRHLVIEEARALVEALPPFVAAVALFVDAEPTFVRHVLASIRVDLLQFHGNETREYCAQFGVPYLRAVRMGDETDLVEWSDRFDGARALLLDAHVPGQPGGTGRTFDWTRIPSTLPIPIVLSGGLDAGNVARAVREVRPFAVDVSSGVESSRGVKDPAKIVEFIRSVRREDADPSR